ncbi:universal stress protein [Salisediminibacterium selenitireducens]|uniref:UspA domain protein n=1 Tax=Bacillus selenitireducens (strain ATCC 700615 / DSM 15326 / MLS10) TaxID=439292 RepID=D6XXH9_BACIE|nr:universal stress protein [Salisediminibacterium selenitireducens]ADH98036.1 UspA domain protein [[Bacillus] selenitireducens MLS10]
MFSNIILAADGSEHSLRAAEKAIALGKLSKKPQIELLHVVSGATSKTDVLHHGDSDAASRKRRKQLDPIVERIERANIPVTVTTITASNSVPESIIKHVNEQNPDVLVLGSRGLSSVQTMVLGSVSHKVMKYVKAPVMMVK